ncbi:MAG: YjbQ family protein [Candidatus Aenigmatarchaeota archaeon]|nr:MAG: YjbQ family protein [Candidatus Aenigmarchaeota archaeon]
MFTKILEFDLDAEEFKDITEEIENFVGETGVESGLLLIFSLGSTSALITIENEEGLLEDFRKLLERFAPKNEKYLHNRIDNNAVSHLKASLLGQSLVLPVKDGKPQLGTWQQVFLLNLDFRPRKRKVILQLIA